MSDDDFGFGPPPFKPDAALLNLKRALRDCKLSERGNGFELRGKRVLELAVDGAAIQVRLARRLVSVPEWDPRRVASDADQRKLLAELKQRLARWENDE